jgi:hypothetical protein
MNIRIINIFFIGPPPVRGGVVSAVCENFVVVGWYNFPGFNVDFIWIQLPLQGIGVQSVTFNLFLYTR